MLDVAVAMAYAHYAQFSRQGWHLAFALCCVGLHALALLSMLLFSAFFVVFIAREVAVLGAHVLRHCAHVGGVLLGVAQRARVRNSVYTWTKVLSSSELSSMQ